MITRCEYINSLYIWVQKYSSIYFRMENGASYNTHQGNDDILAFVLLLVYKSTKLTSQPLLSENGMGIYTPKLISNIPVNMPLVASTGRVLGRCCQHRTSTGPVLATNGMYTGMACDSAYQIVGK